MAKSSPVLFAVGYSARALVEASAQAGFECVAVDHFGDADTWSLANNRWIELQLSEQGLLSNDTRSALQAAVAEFERTGTNSVFLLSGGMENWGGAVEQLREIATVIGPSEDQRRALRNIDFLFDAALGTGIETPALQYNKVSDDRWLWKPHSSAGGLKIVRSEFALVDCDSGYWQEFIDGEQLGVSCLMERSRCQILGVTSSFGSAEWPGPSEFIYRGSMGPVALITENQSQIEKLCQQIHERTEYCGWLQFDFIRDESGQLWLLECNPRWTAGMEVFLFVDSVNPVRELLSMIGFDVSSYPCIQGSANKYSGKAIVYATQTVNLTDDLIVGLNQIEGLADRPYGPQRIECGHPIATVRAGLTSDEASEHYKDNRAKLLEKLKRSAEQVTHLFT